MELSVELVLGAYGFAIVLREHDSISYQVGCFDVAARLSRDGSHIWAGSRSGEVRPKPTYLS
jgi:hypothetical protein